MSEINGRAAVLTPGQIAPIVLRAVRNKRPFVFDHPEQLANFRETYASIVEACYVEAETAGAEELAALKTEA